MASTKVDDLIVLLRSWLPRRRWFAGGGRPGMRIRVCHDVALSDILRHLVVEVSHADDPQPDYYQVPLVIRPDAPFGHEGFLLGESSGGLVYDGLHDPDGSSVLMQFLAAGDRHDGLAAHRLEPLDVLPAHAVAADRSSTSVVFGDVYYLEVYRRLWPGTNPDLEVSRALADAGSTHVARPLAWLDGDVDGVPTTCALMQEYLRSGTKGWLMALTSLRDLFAEGDLHADEVGGDFAAEAERLGAAIAEVHAMLAYILPTRAADPEVVHGKIAHLQARLDAALATGSELRPHEHALRRVYDAMAGEEPAPAFQRIHGDLDLERVMRVDSGWVLFGFGGEPGRSVAERTQLSSPLRDVAGMLRSFDHAAQSMLQEREGEAGLDYRAREWVERNRDAFCRGYGAVSGTDPREYAAMLRAFELDKAVGDAAHHRHHADRRIPLAAVPVLLEAG